MAPLKASYKHIQYNGISNVELSYSSKIKNKCCLYSHIVPNGEINFKDKNINSFNHYLKNVFKRKIFFKTEQSEVELPQQSTTQDFQYKEQNEKNILADDEMVLKSEVKKFLDKNKLNVFKNILYAFNRHVQLCTDEKLIQQYQSFTDYEWPYDHIKIRVSQNLKNAGRSNLKIRNLFKSRNLKKIFIHFLENASEFWLKYSKIKEVESYYCIIQLLLKGSEKDILVGNINFYKKKKQK